MLELVNTYNRVTKAEIERRRNTLRTSTYNEVVSMRTPHTKTNGWYFRQQTVNGVTTTFEVEITRRLLNNQQLRNRQFTTFADIFTIVKAEADDSRLNGGGQMTIYDIAQYIGEHYCVYPADVYLHRGARDGAFNIGLVPYKTHDYILTQAEVLTKFPDLAGLEGAAHIENFLCHYADELEALFNTTRT